MQRPRAASQCHARAALMLPARATSWQRDPVARDSSLLHCERLASDVLLRDMVRFGSPPISAPMRICMPAHGKLCTPAVHVPPGTDALLLLPTHQAEAERAAGKGLRKRTAEDERKEAAHLRRENERLRVSTPAAVHC